MRAVQCPKCNAVCLLAMVDGFKAAVDPGRLDADGVRAVLMAGRAVYAPMYGFKKLRGLRLLTPRTLGGHLRELNPTLGEHACGSGAFSGVPINAPEKPQNRPVCDLRRSGGWTPPFDCPRARPARSEPGGVHPLSCEACDPAPFDGSLNAEYLLTKFLGATVIEVIGHG